ncbi:sigma-70 family RNA polymerase sigma factor [Spirosoma sp. HMF4905]|uniref:Sigma-70 family RNA polymerase sigma factor n=1 Tax=Spirosoma arboris TaxID=2682092 RepID=A0A7K1S4B5_9BACT|nr:sigma-70 family RNA polymerase sigma factor [Spirosoma arboris]MVM28672.1 sigma-70 family RNA polymerase sigma factor [Spirosoma arboris]
MSCLTETIIHQAIQGDKAAFAKVYQHYRTPALKFSISLLKDKEEAENMVHDVFIKIWEKRALINPELNFSSYLFTCLRNMIFDYLKQVEKSQLLRQRYMERMDRTTEEDQEDLETRCILLHKAINALSEKRKLILLLNIEGGKSYQEIAESLRISKNTVKNQLVKAKQLLRERVDLAS